MKIPPNNQFRRIGAMTFGSGIAQPWNQQARQVFGCAEVRARSQILGRVRQGWLDADQQRIYERTEARAVSEFLQLGPRALIPVNACFHTASIVQGESSATWG